MKIYKRRKVRLLLSIQFMDSQLLFKVVKIVSPEDCQQQYIDHAVGEIIKYRRSTNFYCSLRFATNVPFYTVLLHGNKILFLKILQRTLNPAQPEVINEDEDK